MRYFTNILEHRYINRIALLFRHRPAAWQDGQQGDRDVPPKPDGKGTASEADILSSRVRRRWLPVEVVFVDAIPMTSVGKSATRELREKFKAKRYRQAGSAARRIAADAGRDAKRKGGRSVFPQVRPNRVR